MSGKELDKIDKVVKKAASKLDSEAEIQKRVEQLVKKRLAQENRKTIASRIGRDEYEDKKVKGFFKALISDTGLVSSRRFIVLIISLHFIITAFYVVFAPNEIPNEALVKQIIEAEYLIILVGLGFITGSGLVSILVQKFRAQAMNGMGGFGGGYGGFGGFGGDDVSLPTGDGKVPVGDLPATGGPTTDDTGPL